MSAGVLVRCSDLERTQALYRDVFHLESQPVIETTQGPLLLMPRKGGGCLFALEAEGPPVEHGIPVVVPSGAVQRALDQGARVGSVTGVVEVVDLDGNVFWAFTPSDAQEERYETGVGAPILPLIYALERGQLDPFWLQVWGHGGRDPVTTAWSVSVGYLGDLVAALGMASEAQQACDIANALRPQMEHIFVEEHIRQSMRAPTLQDAELACRRRAR